MLRGVLTLCDIEEEAEYPGNLQAPANQYQSVPRRITEETLAPGTALDPDRDSNSVPGQASCAMAAEQISERRPQPHKRADKRAQATAPEKGR